MPRKKKYTFVLKNISVEKIRKKYNIELVSNLNNPPIQLKTVTKLSNITLTNPKSKTYSFLDETKKSHNIIITMTDITTNKKLLPFPGMQCFWHRLPFDHTPLGCPIEYQQSHITKTYERNSKKGKCIYVINEFIPKLTRKKLGNDCKINEIYFTDGIFCSFNCCLSFIRDNEGEHMYSESEELLMQLYLAVFGTSPENITEAPHWRTLTVHKGYLTETEYFRCFNKITYEDHGIIKFSPIGVMYEENVSMR